MSVGPRELVGTANRPFFRPDVIALSAWPDLLKFHQSKYNFSMPQYIRNYVAGATYFFTLVTHKRQPFLTTELARSCLKDSIKKVRNTHPFEVKALVLLPDHLHTLLRMPNGDSDYSMRLNLIKGFFTRAFSSQFTGSLADVSTNRKLKRERGVWQTRFWEHTIKDEDDFKRCLDYIHYNPVKHGLVERVVDYPWSTFHKYVELGEYEIEWGTGEIGTRLDKYSWGE